MTQAVDFTDYDSVEYENATHVFYCRAAVGSALGSPVWQIGRLTKATNRYVHADGNLAFDNLATSLAIVAALEYTEDA